MIDINNLRKIRKSLDLTQFELAKKANVSQSLIAKIESQKLDPTYSKVKKIDEAIKSLSNIHEKTAKDFMNTKIIFINKDTKRNKIKELMLKHGISHIPIIENDKILGLVTERSLLHNEEAKIAEEAMIEPCPIINKDTNINLVKSILDYSSIILIQDKGKIIGIITRADLL